MEDISLIKNAIITKASALGLSCQNITNNRVTINPYEVLISKIPDCIDRGNIINHIDECLKDALTIWKEIGQAQGSDIYYIFVAPRNTKNKEFWFSMATEIERDERLCRKLVWIPDENEGADMFLNRTFLARPWAEGSVENSSSLSVLEQELGIPKPWVKLLQNDKLSNRELLIRLMNKMES